MKIFEENSPQTLNSQFSILNSKRILTIRENHLFQKVYGRGKSFVSPFLALHILRNYNRNETRVGFTVSKARGNAVTRNAVRRRMKEAYRAHHPFIKKGFLIVIVARQAAVGRSSTELGTQLNGLMKKAGLFEN